MIHGTMGSLSPALRGKPVLKSFQNILVKNFILFVFPKFQYSGAVGYRLPDERDRVGTLPGDDLGDESIVEAYLRGLGFGIAVDDPVQVGPVDRRKAHGAGLTRAVEFAACEVKAPQDPARFPDCQDFGVGSGIVASEHFVVGDGDDLFLMDDNRPERASVACRDSLMCFLRRQMQIVFDFFLFFHGSIIAVVSWTSDVDLFRYSCFVFRCR